MRLGLSSVVFFGVGYDDVERHIRPYSTKYGDDRISIEIGGRGWD